MTSETTAAIARILKCFEFICQSSQSGTAAAASALERGECNPAQPEQQRNSGDVYEFEHALEPIDIRPHGVLDVPKLLACIDHFAAELLDRFSVIIAQDDVAVLRLALDFGQLGLQVVQPCDECLLLLPELALGITANVVNQLERPIVDAASTQPRKRLATRQVLESIDDERRIVPPQGSKSAGPAFPGSAPRTRRRACRNRQR